MRFDSKRVEPLDQRYIGVFSGDKNRGKEISLNGRAEKSIRGAAAPLRASNPIDIFFVTTNPEATSPIGSRLALSDMEILLARLESLDENHLRVSEEVLDRRKVIVYRVKASPTPKSRAITASKIVVSAEGIDKGLVILHTRDSMKLGDQRPYENDNQLIGDQIKSQRIYWKEFEVKHSDEGKQRVVLPISVARKDKLPNGGFYMNATLEWNSFESPKKELRSFEACEKIAREFDQQISKALNR